MPPGLRAVCGSRCDGSWDPRHDAVGPPTQPSFRTIGGTNFGSGRCSVQAARFRPLCSGRSVQAARFRPLLCSEPCSAQGTRESCSGPGPNSARMRPAPPGGVPARARQEITSRRRCTPTPTTPWGDWHQWNLAVLYYYANTRGAGRQRQAFLKGKVRKAIGLQEQGAPTV